VSHTPGPLASSRRAGAILNLIIAAAIVAGGIVAGVVEYPVAGFAVSAVAAVLVVLFARVLVRLPRA
jgi:hypothetical protein